MVFKAMRLEPIIRGVKENKGSRTRSRGTAMLSWVGEKNKNHERELRRKMVQ